MVYTSKKKLSSQCLVRTLPLSRQRHQSEIAMAWPPRKGDDVPNILHSSAELDQALKP